MAELPKTPNEWVCYIEQHSPVRPIEYKNGQDFMEELVLALKEAAERAKNNQWCNLPRKLENSLVDPKFMQIHDDSFREMYSENVKDTVEESIMEILYLCYERVMLDSDKFDEDRLMHGLEHIEVSSVNKITGLAYMTRFLDMAKTLDRTYNSNFAYVGVAKAVVSVMISLLVPLKIEHHQYMQWYLRFYKKINS